jgi:magnesium-transporting ATPase (P-type)
VAAHSPAVARTEWFLFLGSTALLVLFVVRSPGWFWQGPRPSLALLLALGGCFALTVALINVPVMRDLLGFAPLSWSTQFVIEAYGLAYLVLADVIRRAYHRQVVPPPDRVE